MVSYIDAPLSKGAGNGTVIFLLVSFSPPLPLQSYLHIEDRYVHTANQIIYVRVCMFSPVQLFVTLWTVTCQAPLSMGFSRQEYWNGLPFPPLEDFPDPGIEPASPSIPGLASGFFYH